MNRESVADMKQGRPEKHVGFYVAVAGASFERMRLPEILYIHEGGAQ